MAARRRERRRSIGEGDLRIRGFLAALTGEQQRDRRRRCQLGAAEVGDERLRQVGRHDEPMCTRVREVVPGAVLVGRGMADDRDLTEAVEAGVQFGPGETQPGERPRATRRQQEIGRLEELVEAHTIRHLLQVERHDLLARTELVVPGRMGGGERVSGGRLDLDHRRAERHEPRGRGRPGHVDGQRDGPDVIQGPHQRGGIRNAPSSRMTSPFK